MGGMANAFMRHVYIVMLNAVIGCAAVPGYEVGIVGRDHRAVLHVTNRGLDHLQLSLLRSGANIPIGSVPALGSRTFYLTGSQLGNGGALQLRAGTRANVSVFQSAVFSATVGQLIEWVIDRALASDVVIVKSD
jgi:hypothetical protein